MESDRNNESLAFEMVKTVKQSNLFYARLLVIAFIIILLEAAGLVAQSIYHDYQWSQFDTVIVDSEDYGNANYVGGDNSGGIYNGESGGKTP